MEEVVNSIRDTFYRDLAAGYRRDAERSFLYRYFWRESARELLEKVFPGLPAEEGPRDGAQMRERLRAAMAEDPARARELLLREPPGEGRKERRDFWQELMLNDAGYQAGLLTDTDYYLWLTAYLAARDIYYKDRGPWDTDRPLWLGPLLRAGLGRVDCAATKAQTERDLAALARLLREERAAGKSEAAARLHGLRQRIRREGQIRQVDYLPFLTGRLERMALHVKIKTWLQDNGYPLRTEGGAGAAPKAPRKQDFSMRLFEAYCGSPGGYDFIPRELTGWHLRGGGFCVLDADGQRLQALLSALERRDGPDGGAYLYLPLAVHLQSGCVFFLAGRGLYEGLYEAAAGEARDAYRRGRARFCFDYLRLDSAFWLAEQGASGGPFRLRPTFHENMDRSYDAVLNDFKRYCVAGAASVLQTVREFNLDVPAGAPEVFRWAFDTQNTPEGPRPSRQARGAFRRERRRTP